MTSPEIERFEQRGFFLTIPFPDEENPTVLYVADQDFETLKDMLETPDTTPEDFQNELIELIEHSGHEKEHTFTPELTEALMETILEQERPEETVIEDPFEVSEENPPNLDE